MNKLTFFYFPGTIEILFSCSPAEIQKESGINPNDIVRWTDTTKLNWSEFQDKPSKRTKTYSKIAVQLTTKLIRLQSNSKSWKYTNLERCGN